MRKLAVRALAACQVVGMATSLVVGMADAQAKDHGKGKGHGNGAAPAAAYVGGSGVNVNVVFSAGDRGIITQWVQAQPVNGLPPGLRKGLPPGLAKQLARKGTLPPGLQKKLTPFPPALVGRLAPPPPGCDYVFVDGKALIIARATQAILDVISLF